MLTGEERDYPEFSLAVNSGWSAGFCGSDPTTRITTLIDACYCFSPTTSLSSFSSKLKNVHHAAQSKEWLQNQPGSAARPGSAGGPACFCCRNIKPHILCLRQINKRKDLKKRTEESEPASVKLI